MCNNFTSLPLLVCRYGVKQPSTVVNNCRLVREPIPLPTQWKPTRIDHFILKDAEFKSEVCSWTQRQNPDVLIRFPPLLV